MKLPKALLGAILVGMTVQATGCTKKDNPEPKGEQTGKKAKDVVKPPYDCPGCGLG